MPKVSQLALLLASPDAWGDAIFEASTRATAFVGREGVSTINSTPAVYEQGSAETRSLSFDFSADLDTDDSEAIASASVVLLDLISGTTYAAGLSGANSYAGAVVTQAVTALVAGRKYLLTVIVVTSIGETHEQGLRISCPY
jgi:hypothetical protein